MQSKVEKIEWVDAIKGFAIIAVLLNHFVESYGAGGWFSNPSSEWPAFAVRMAHLFPPGSNIVIRCIKFAAWLLDMGAGVFFLLSGLTLTMSALNKPLKPISFYNKRLLRIYPLYICIHLIVFFSATLWFKWHIHFFSIKTALSLLGLRFTGALFFYINPSWWFMWVIIQMYLLFPYLLMLLQKKGIKIFMIVTFSITILCRLFGILALTHSRHLFEWMTGIFAGTRLFEFALGIILGYLLFNNNVSLTNFLKKKVAIFFLSIGLLALGFAASWTYTGSLVSNIIMTIAFTCFFYSVFEIFFKQTSVAKKILFWAGGALFSVFLLHQPYMMYASTTLSGTPKLIALIAIIVLSFVAGYAIEKFVGAAMKFVLQRWKKTTPVNSNYT